MKLQSIRLVLLPLALFASVANAQPLRFEVSVAERFATEPLDGRVLLMISTTDKKEPRFLIREGADSQQIFGVDVDGLRPSTVATIDRSVLSFPLESLSAVPAGDYFVQALLHRYETFHRSDGHVLKLPMDRGEGQHWNTAPGNLFSKPQKLHVDPSSDKPIRIVLDQQIPPIEPPKDTQYVRHLRIQSDLLTRFWGRPMHLGAVVLLPRGFDEHPEARFPLMLNHGHFEDGFDEFRETPPDPNLKPEYSERFRMDGYNRVQQECAHQFYKEWTGSDFPRFVVLKVQHANPYYDDSYAVNSANLGPYGDAIMKELLPVVEEKFRCIGRGWSRFTYGGSTGGWEALAVQMFYPDEFNGCFAACPDPIDFRAYASVNIYEDKNAFFAQGPWNRVPRPAGRDHNGVTTATMEQANRLELVLGIHSRSGGQWDIWEAVFSPVGPDGYPARIYDKRSGIMDPKVAAYWRDHYDLRYILERDWATLGPKLSGKIHIYCGTMDNYFLNNAVALMENFLKKAANPPFNGLVDYECGAEHCWNGDHTRPNAISRMRYHQMYLDQILKQIEATAPKGSDLSSWRYK
ncbi:MAG TPA: alpha/beta hydrolase-fold protein [Phycisphaerae bacterium]|nr:alpha/beta hydrolase-fold protein [Phycisphaerae bacterium]